MDRYAKGAVRGLWSQPVPQFAGTLGALNFQNQQLLGLKPLIPTTRWRDSSEAAVTAARLEVTHQCDLDHFYVFQRSMKGSVKKYGCKSVHERGTRILEMADQYDLLTAPDPSKPDPWSSEGWPGEHPA